MQNKPKNVRESRKCKSFCPTNAHFDGRLRGAVCSFKRPPTSCPQCYNAFNTKAIFVSSFSCPWLFYRSHVIKILFSPGSFNLQLFHDFMIFFHSVSRTSWIFGVIEAYVLWQGQLRSLKLALIHFSPALLISISNTILITKLYKIMTLQLWGLRRKVVSNFAN